MTTIYAVSTGLDRSTPFTFDNALFGQIRGRRGVCNLNSGSQQMKPHLVRWLNTQPTTTYSNVSLRMVKMRAVDVLTGKTVILILEWIFGHSTIINLLCFLFYNLIFDCLFVFSLLIIVNNYMLGWFIFGWIVMNLSCYFDFL